MWTKKNKRNDTGNLHKTHDNLLLFEKAKVNNNKIEQFHGDSTNPLGNHDCHTTKGVRETDMNSFKPTDIVNTKPKSIEPLNAYGVTDKK